MICTQHVTIIKFPDFIKLHTLFSGNHRCFAWFCPGHWPLRYIGKKFKIPFNTWWRRKKSHLLRCSNFSAIQDTTCMISCLKNHYALPNFMVLVELLS